MINFDRLSYFFAFLLAGVTAYFLIWGLNYTNYANISIFVMATLFGIFMAFNIGGNDVANSFGTSVGAGTLTMKQALAVAAIFEVSGAIIAGGEVTNTIRGDIVDLSVIELDPRDFMLIMMSALLAAALWLLFATKKGYPVSTTHTIIGGIIGSSIVLGILLNGGDSAFALVQWGEVVTIASSWIISPLLGGLVSYGLFSLINKHIILYNEEAERQLERIRLEKKKHKEEHKHAFERLDDIEQIAYAGAMARDAHDFHEEDMDPDQLESEYFRVLHDLHERKQNVFARKALETWVPLVASLGAIIITAMLVFKGLKNLDFHLDAVDNILIMAMVGTTVWMGTLIFTKNMKHETLSKSTFVLFSWMQVFTASGFAFSHGSNDIANAIGPFAAILDVLRTGNIGSSASIPTITMVTFGVALVAGLWFIGREVIMTVGHHLTSMHPASGFAAELSAATVVLMASLLGIPVSSTHILIGSVLGIGIVNSQTNWGLMKPIGLAWVITLPAAALLSGLLFIGMRQIF
jgi:PiT family inorganic phosphate transporter